jgi:hypothetical protein
MILRRPSWVFKASPLRIHGGRKRHAQTLKVTSLLLKIPGMGKAVRRWIDRRCNGSWSAWPQGRSIESSTIASIAWSEACATGGRALQTPRASITRWLLAEPVPQVALNTQGR